MSASGKGGGAACLNSDEADEVDDVADVGVDMVCLFVWSWCEVVECGR